MQPTLSGTGVRRSKGGTETAAEKLLTRWRKQGHHVDELTSSQLRGAARDVDAATEDYRDRDGSIFTITRARSLLLEVQREAAPTEQVAAEDPFEDLVDRILASDGAGPSAG